MRIASLQRRLLGSLALATAFIASGANAAEKFVFLTDWFAQAEHGGFYQAQALDLYKQAGLDVTIVTTPDAGDAPDAGDIDVDVCLVTRIGVADRVVPERWAGSVERAKVAVLVHPGDLDAASAAAWISRALDGDRRGCGDRPGPRRPAPSGLRRRRQGGRSDRCIF